MKLFNTEKRQWKNWLVKASDDELVEERNRLRELRRDAKQRMLDIQAEVETRAPKVDPGEVIRFG